jgi:hypothetical protein
MSTGSDPNEPPSSLLARLSAKRNEAADNASGGGPQPNYGRPTNGPNLRVDTGSLESGAKANNYPYTSNPALPAHGVRQLSDLSAGGVSPAPATAGPDFGRHNAARMDVVGYNQRLVPNNMQQQGSGHIRHSYNNSESSNVGSQRSGVSSPFAPDGARISPPHGHAHARSDSGSGHQWAAPAPRNSWGPDMAVQAGRYNERTWA